MWAFLGAASAAAVLLGARLNRPAHRWPWRALAAGLLAFAAGNAYYNAQEASFHASHPVPSPAVVCSLAVYSLFTAGLFGLLRHRRVGHDLPALLDALIITTALALPVWLHLVQPLSRPDGLTWQQRAIAIAYPLGDLLVLALLARLLAPDPASVPNPAARLLLLGTLTLLCFDIAYGVLQLNSTWRAGTLLDFGRIVFCTAWGLAALHPSMAELTEPRSPPQSQLPPWRRLLVLAVASLVPPALLVVEANLGDVSGATVLATASGALYVLVILRLTVMVVAHRKAVAREQVLRSAGAGLDAAFWPEEITQACTTAVEALFGPRGRHAVVVLSAREAQELYARAARTPTRTGSRRVRERGEAAREEPAGLARYRTLLVPGAGLAADLAVRLGTPPAALICPITRPGPPAGAELRGALLAAGHEQPLTEMRGSLDLLASHAGLATERVLLRQEVVRRQSEAYFRTLVHNASDVILIVNDNATVRYASPSARAVFGNAELTGAELPDLMDPLQRDRVIGTLTALRKSDRREEHDHWLVVRGDDRVEVEVRCRDLRQDRTVGGLVVTLRDVTEQRQLEHELTRRAFHDSLTGLPNRTMLLERARSALLRGRESPLTCLLFIDLDDFKVVNDSLGHPAGDRLLRAVAERLSAMLRPVDTAARLGGDEFAVLMEEAGAPRDAELLAAQVLRTLGRPFRLSGESVSVSASVGVATARDSTDAQELLALADLALYAAKAAGKRQWRRFQPQQRVRMVERHDLRARLDRAIARQEFDLRYQPVVDIQAGGVVGFEALARWHHLGHDPVPPGRFIPLAEETGHISSLGGWVLRHATADIARLQRRTRRSTPPYVSVNVSARQWRDAGFLDEVCAAVDSTALAPGSLQLELTESVLMRRTDRIDVLLRALKDRGVRIAVDDFGTGYSSLRYLGDFPVDVLKIDKTFIDGIPHDPRQVALVEGIVHLADALGLQVIAEGIEAQEQRALLSRIGCRYGQGFLFARPMTLEQSEAVLRTGGSGPG
ncbi:EAL domain-containing protein [Streptomyces sp. SID5643]|uniref:putative bifunctional diguanylate cyclase/phosphodiesterase n=1 Tax=Streptomyces sp. SID5643 TaxID=2690307 RepID=UPI001F1ED319|nr:EAL domain-containing protein [Streptomyces sp. SID5643]